MITTDTGEAYENEFHHAIDSPLPEVQLASMINPENDPFHGKPDAGGAAGPLSRPETIGKAAVKHTETGKVYTGVNHGEAAINAEDEIPGLDFNKLQQGFTTSSGRFVDHREANKIARENDQIAKGSLSSHRMDRLHSEDVIPKNAPEYVDRAAVQSRAGDIHVDQIGSSHTDILKQIPDKMEQAWSNDGFITNEGRFIDRYEAQRVGVASGQLDPKTTNMNKGAISEDFPHINKARWEKTINHLEEMKQHTDRWDDLMLPGDKEDFLGHLKDYVKDKFK